MNITRQGARALLGITLLLLASGIWAQDIVPTATPDSTIEIDVEDAAQGAIGLTETVARGTAGSITNLIERILTPPTNELARVVLVIGGVVLLLAGWRISELVIVLAGILIGASIGSSLISDADPVLQIVALIVGALLGALVSALLYYVAVFFMGAYIGVVLTGAVAQALGYETVSAVVLLLGAILGGIVLLGLSFQFLIFLAALVGGQMLALGLGLGPTWVVLFVVLGVILQVALARTYGYDIRRAPSRRLWLLRRR